MGARCPAIGTSSEGRQVQCHRPLGHFDKHLHAYRDRDRPQILTPWGVVVGFAWDQRLLGPWDGEFLVRWLASPHLAGRIPEPSPGAFLAWGEMPEERRNQVGELGCMLGFTAPSESC